MKPDNGTGKDDVAPQSKFTTSNASDSIQFEDTIIVTTNEPSTTAETGPLNDAMPSSSPSKIPPFGSTTSTPDLVFTEDPFDSLPEFPERDHPKRIITSSPRLITSTTTTTCAPSPVTTTTQPPLPLSTTTEKIFKHFIDEDEDNRTARTFGDGRVNFDSVPT